MKTSAAIGHKLTDQGLCLAALAVRHKTGVPRFEANTVAEMMTFG